MRQSLRHFLTGIVDYAGLFPPATLPLDAAIRNYARYREQPEAWMLARFSCPAVKLAELAPYGDGLLAHEPPFAFSVLGQSGETIQEFGANLRTDLQALASFRRRHGERVTVEVFEVRLPATIVRAVRPESVREVAEMVAPIIEADGPPKLAPFFEAGFAPDWRSELAAVIGGIALHNRDWAATRFRSGPVGFKLRCGGLEPADFPTPEQVAFVIRTCRGAQVPLKATAGLHHPFRHFSQAVGTKMHGFINVFGAGILAQVHALDEASIRAVIEDESPESFRFQDDRFAWKDLHAGNEAVASARQTAVTSFGSCSFDEPRDDLRALGWL